MKKKMNVIQIRGIRGLVIVAFVVCCLAAGFIAFPGFVCMYVWNFCAAHISNLPAIGILQGLLLWGIMVAAYFTFKKDKFVVCFKTPEGLSEEELKAVFADMKQQSVEDPIIQAMMKAREAELNIKNLENPEKLEETEKEEIKK